jgi:hypothetical protein
MLSTRGAATWFAKVELSAITRGALAGRGAEATQSFACRRGRGNILRPRLLPSRRGSVR